MKTATFVAATAVVFAALLAPALGQRITTIQLDGVQYFISRMNPYSPELNFFLAYQYCRSLGLQLTSFETKEKADAMTAYLRNAGHHKYDFWTSGNKLGTDMHLWMSTGLPFNATFDYMNVAPNVDGVTIHPEESVLEEEENEARSADSAHHSCVVLKAPDHRWATDDCAAVKDFICEQTRCYYYNYGSIPVSTAQGPPKPHTTPVKLPPSESRVPPKPLPLSTTTTTTTPATTTTAAAPATFAPEPTAAPTPPPLLNITVKRGANLRAQPTPPVLVQFSVPARHRLSEDPMPAAAELKFGTPSRHRIVEEAVEPKQAFVGADHAKHTPRNIEGKTGGGNVVYVKAIGAKNGVAGWSLAYVGKDNGRTDDVAEHEAANKRKNPELAD